MPGIDSSDLLRAALDRWKDGIDRHDPGAVGEVFTSDTIFQGLRPFTVGRQGVVDYYASQPVGMTVDYRVLDSRRLGDDAVLGYLAACFTFPDGQVKDVSLGVVLTRDGGSWHIAYYQASVAPG